ncbi:phosphoglycerate mutase-like protein [Amniculicola lignicola CBS 123094]|uniref:Phosphoglycerate mutase-like protein n=1 Tax=Amniculicola lignicola CBS 123094 TaxID=1392246 RepID=A0A6A5WY19_9PLEO|nr:phosphoglycerate mutase-like protein [Amniculicola lignicola CBS 123094]
MAQQVKLFLIRHGETVDNVAQVYAGTTDSVLTNHGYQQATRLGLHFKAMGLSFTHLFSSHLQRAATTAGLIQEAQVALPATDRSVPNVVQLPVLMEQDFGFYEGKKWYDKRDDPKATPGFVDIESKESLAQRADAFLDSHLLPLLNSSTGPTSKVIAVVSHGIMLSTLWKRLLARLPHHSVTFAPELLANTRAPTLEHLGGWSNTGYLELHMQYAVSIAPLESATQAELPQSQDIAGQTSVEAVVDDVPVTKSTTVVATGSEATMKSDQPTGSVSQGLQVRLPTGWTTTIQSVNGKDHLGSLKRTRGGVGSARHDSSQKNIESFFKRKKLE